MAPGADQAIVRPAPAVMFGQILGLLLLLAVIPWLLVQQPSLGLAMVWSVVFALLPMGLMMGGFAVWRQVCPLSIVSRLPRTLGIGGRVRLGKRWQRHGVWFQAGVFVLLVAARFAWFEDSAAGTLFLLGALAVAALTSGFIFTGKTWCTNLCPVSYVERVYAGPVAASNPSDSRCTFCTACKTQCADIDVEAAYWKEGLSGSRRLTTYAFSGIVLGYVAMETSYGAVRRSVGTWSYLPADDGLARAVLALSAMLVLALAAAALAWLLENVLGRKAAQAVHARHVLALSSAFIAFNLYYSVVLSGWTAGDPLLLRIGWVATATISGAYIWRVTGRQQTDYVRERVARRVLEDQGVDPRGHNLMEVFYRQSTQKDNADRFAGAYQAALQDAIADGVVSASEADILERLRRDLDIAPAVHAKSLQNAQMPGQDTIVPTMAGEKHLQLASYHNALLRALVDGTITDDEARQLKTLRRRYGISNQEHDAVFVAAKREASLAPPATPPPQPPAFAPPKV